MRRLLDQDPRREQRRQARLIDRLSRQFRGAIENDLTDASENMARVWRETREVPPPAGLEDALTETYQRMATAAALTFGSRVYEQGKSIGYQLERKEDFADWMARFALQYIASEAIRKRIKSVTATTRAQIIAVIEAGYRDGDTLDEITNALLEMIPSLSRTRAELIARTETHGAANHGATEAAKRTGLPLQKEWISASDERTRDPTHIEADGQIVDLEEPFEVGESLMQFPGDPSGAAEEVINCRCAVGHIVKDDP